MLGRRLPLYVNITRPRTLTCYLSSIDRSYSNTNERISLSEMSCYAQRRDSEGVHPSTKSHSKLRCWWRRRTAETWAKYSHACTEGKQSAQWSIFKIEMRLSFGHRMDLARPRTTRQGLAIYKTLPTDTFNAQSSDWMTIWCWQISAIRLYLRLWYPHSLHTLDCLKAVIWGYLALEEDSIPVSPTALCSWPRYSYPFCALS